MFQLTGHIEETLTVMSRHARHELPNFLLKQDGLLTPFQHESFYGQLQGFVAEIQNRADALKTCLQM